MNVINILKTYLKHLIYKLQKRAKSPGATGLLLPQNSTVSFK